MKEVDESCDHSWTFTELYQPKGAKYNQRIRKTHCINCAKLVSLELIETPIVLEVKNDKEE